MAFVTNARFSRCRRVHAIGRGVFMATAENMIVTTRRWAALANRHKDRDDVRNVIAARGVDLDWAHIERQSAPTTRSGAWRYPRVDSARLNLGAPRGEVPAKRRSRTLPSSQWTW